MVETATDHSITLEQGWANVFCKGTDNKYFSFVGHEVSEGTTHLCHSSVKTAIDNIGKQVIMPMSQ